MLQNLLAVSLLGASLCGILQAQSGQARITGMVSDSGVATISVA